MGKMEREFTSEEIEAAIDAAGRRNIANWDELPDYSRLQVRSALRELALEWLRVHRPERAGAACQGGADILPAWWSHREHASWGNLQRSA
jgi:hypothetical protein